MTSEPRGGRGRLAIVGLGPGAVGTCTPDVRTLLVAATDWVGYGTYLDLAAAIVEPTRAQSLHRSNNRVEADRARFALDLAADGHDVALVSSGDPGVFAMAAAIMEQLDTDPDPHRWAAAEVSIHPGISAAQAAAARAGAPLGHDFCVISLSDNLKPFSIIERRLDAAAGADFVIALYNPRSRHRPDQLDRALAVLGRHRAPATPVVLGRDVGRPDEQVRVVTLDDLANQRLQAEVDMRTVVIVGSSQTRTVDVPGDDRGVWVYTPRSYPD